VLLRHEIRRPERDAQRRRRRRGLRIGAVRREVERLAGQRRKRGGSGKQTLQLGRWIGRRVDAIGRGRDGDAARKREHDRGNLLKLAHRIPFRAAIIPGA
jgi:hypothetical protein